MPMYVPNYLYIYHVYCMGSTPTPLYQYYRHVLKEKASQHAKMYIIWLHKKITHTHITYIYIYAHVYNMKHWMKWGINDRKRNRNNGKQKTKSSMYLCMVYDMWLRLKMEHTRILQCFMDISSCSMWTTKTWDLNLVSLHYRAYLPNIFQMIPRYGKILDG